MKSTRTFSVDEDDIGRVQIDWGFDRKKNRIMPKGKALIIDNTVDGDDPMGVYKGLLISLREDGPTGAVSYTDYHTYELY